MRTRIAASLAFFIVSAAAFAASPTAGSDTGPFPPRADPVLNGPVPRVIAPAPSIGTTPVQPLDAATVSELQRDADAKRLDTLAAEVDLDRSERRARNEQMRAAATPAPAAPGAWNGETDPRTR